MFSKTERKYLLGEYLPTKSHRRVLNHRIKNKLKKLFMLELPLLKRSSVTDFGNNVTEFVNDIETQSILKQRSNNTQAKLIVNFAKNLGSLHSMDSANACGALGRRFESGRARLIIRIYLLAGSCVFMCLASPIKFSPKSFPQKVQ